MDGSCTYFALNEYKRFEKKEQCESPIEWAPESVTISSSDSPFWAKLFSNCVTLKKASGRFFWSVFGWVERIKLNGGAYVFSPLAHQKVLSKIERKLKREIGYHFWTKMPMYNCTFTYVAFFTFFFFLFFLRYLPFFFL